MTSLPNSYKGQHHPEINFNRECNLCALSCGQAVGGAGPDDLSKLRLIVISDHPGNLETDAGYPLVPHQRERKKIQTGPLKGTYTLQGFKSAGKYLREVLSSRYGLDTYQEVWITNAIKCPTQLGKIQRTISTKHMRACVKNHLLQELTIIDQYCPNIPILLAGRYALDSLKYLDDSVYRAIDGKMKKARRTNHHRLWNHPLVFTFNPASVADAEFRMETERGYACVKEEGLDIKKITEVRRLSNLPGSPQWIYEGDLKWLDEFLPC